MHQTSGRWKLGLGLSLITATFWGVLPIALKGILDTIDSYTITWYRFVVSLVFVGLVLYRRNRIPNFKWLFNVKQLSLFLLVIFGLSSNYILYLLGLDLVTPSAAQVVIQLAPLLLLIGGLVVFKEAFSLLQWLGVIVFVIGLGLFFNHRLDTLFDSQSSYNVGVFLVVLAAATWAIYALAQKQLLMKYGSQQIMFIAYLAASVLFLPSATVSSVFNLSTTQWFLLIFCCANTLIAYGCFAEALEHWQASRVSAVLAITPIITILSTYVTNAFLPGYITFEELNLVSIVGAFIIVIGSLVTALSKPKRNLDPQ
jgi:drug/metabolite transporter (DMT)-like permease